MVFKGIKRLWRIMCFFIRVKKVWSQPRQSDVLIYDAVRLEQFLKYLSPWHPVVMHLRGEQINMRVLFSSLLRRGARLDSYIECFIEKVRPRLVVTFVDNNRYFHTINRKFPEVKTLFIQNGLRTFDLYCYEQLNSNSRSKFSVDYMMVFGKYVGLEYEKLILGKAVPMGCIVNNFVRKESPSKPGVIAFLSQYDPYENWNMVLPNKAGFACSYDDYYWKTDGLILKCLLRYAKEKSKRVMIIPRHLKGADLYGAEKAYFREILGSEPEYLEPEGPHPGYQAVDSAEVTVSAGSTLGYEAISRGNKAAIFSIRLTLGGLPAGNFGWPGDLPDEGPYWTNKPDPNSFERILDYLFEVDDEQWREDVKASNFSSILAYDPGNTILKSTLEKVLGASTVSEN